MPRILTTCPTSGEVVATGHRTADFDLATMVGSRSFRCATCQQVHAWTADAAVAEVRDPLLN